MDLFKQVFMTINIVKKYLIKLKGKKCHKTFPNLYLLLPLRLIAGSKFIKELAVHLHKCF